MLIGVMILNYNGARWLSPLYEALGKAAIGGFRLYLVDNGSHDESIALTLDLFPQVTVLRMPENLGYSMAYNLAMPLAFADGCDWVILANNDIRLEPNCLAELARAAAETPGVGILGPAFLAWDSDEPNYYMRGVYPQVIPAMQARLSSAIEVDWVEGSFLMVSKFCMDDIGPLDPCFFFYWEEADFCRRARYRGWKVVLVPSAIARHYAGGSTRICGDDRFERLQTRNYYIYTLTNVYSTWWHNCIDAFHLLLVRLKAGIFLGEIAIWTELKVFRATLMDWRIIRRKWLRDRAGTHPPSLQGIAMPVNVVVIGGTGVVT
ncbi:glycosyltransferase family 2 protein [uncultured Thiodictyon sp.]|jgi:GT2 family glycosyltransferase|uniref:glycosyltransferase family 2 protein n=1 Tax=uncultured Thiodictyon sp. TaxID=1846217 RepID=UPI0025D2E12A|nr:glycosyltransferase family 2 protein [uncultured Thiodictyon sp.]